MAALKSLSNHQWTSGDTMVDLIFQSESDFIYVGIVSSLAVLLTYLTMLKAGLGRIKYKVEAPSHDGPEDYVRMVRVHRNTIEHVVLFLPSMWLFAFAVDPLWAAGIGIIWPIARVFYALGYYKDAPKRMTPLLVSMPVLYVFMAGSLIGFIYKLVA
jgi:glutathione S-transferase